MLFSATKVREFISRPQPVPGENWFLAMLTPSSRAFDELRTFQLKAGLFLLVVLATTAVLLFWLSRRISRPLEQMAAFSQKVSSGKREARLQVKGNDEVAMLSNSLNDLAESLGHYEKELVRVETLASLGKMSSLIAHEIRNPLNAIKGSVQYLQLKHPKDPLILDYSGIILNKVDRLARFVENLLKFSRLPAPDIQQIDAEQLFAQALEPLQELAGQHGVVFQIDLDPIKFLHCDEDQVCQLIQNVARNALEAMPKGGLFKIQARQDAHTVCIAFRDTGPGVPSEIRSRLFLPFTTHKKGGTGLGLHLCCLIAENHHGTFEYEPSDEGAFFILKIPYRE
jgi:signal transduction histidine kinase